MRAEYFTLGFQVVIAFILGFTTRMMWLNNKNAQRTMGIITETLQIQSQVTHELIRRVHQLEQRMKELEDARAAHQ